MRERRAGVWQLRVFTGSDPVTGRNRVVTETFRGTAKAARDRLGQLEADKHKPRSSRTLAQAIDAWRADAAHELGTARNYDLAVRTLSAALLRTPLARITATIVRDAVQSALSAHNVHRARNVHALLSGALGHAWRMEWIAENPARRVRVPAQPKRAPTQPSDADVIRLFRLVADDHQLTAWLFLAADAGARRSEVLATRWSRLRLDAGELVIDSALDPIDMHVKGTKTGHVRTVALGPVTVAALRRWRAELLERALSAGVRLAADPFVFSDALDAGAPWRPDLATRRFRRLADRAGLDRVRLHDLRHAVATILLAEGIDAKTGSGRLGHDRVATFTDRYAHVVPASDRLAAEAIARRLHPAPEVKQRRVVVRRR